MPVHLIPHILSKGSKNASVVHPNVFTALFVVVVFVVIRRWAAGKDLIARLHLRAKAREKERLKQQGKDAKKDEEIMIKNPERDLHGLTLLVVATLTPTSLIVIQSLASRGAQLILLLPASYFTEDAGQVDTLQMLELLRDGTSNLHIYAEKCDMLDLASIDVFTSSWNEGEGGGSVGAGPAGGRAASGLPTGGLGKPAGGDFTPAGKQGDDDIGGTRAPRRCDGIVLLPYTIEQLQYSSAAAQSSTKSNKYGLLERELLGKFHLINSLLSELLLLPPERDIRILNWVSPWYAAGSQRFLEEANLNSSAEKGSKKEKNGKSTADKTSRTAPAAAPILSNLGSTTLHSLLLFYELQRRLTLLAEADPRPRNPLPGILDNDSPISSVDSANKGRSGGKGKHYPNVNVIPICPGFERDGEVWQWLWPRRTTSSSTVASRNPFAILYTLLRKLSLLILYPLLFVLAKSPKAASDQFLWGILAPLNIKAGCEGILLESAAPKTTATTTAASSSSSSPSPSKTPAPSTKQSPSTSWQFEPSEDSTSPHSLTSSSGIGLGWRGILPGRLYREGRVIQPFPVGLQEQSKDGRVAYYQEEFLAELWSQWEHKVKDVGGRWRGVGGGK